MALGNKGLGGVSEHVSHPHIRLKEITTPTAVPNEGQIYTKADNSFYFQDGAGIEHLIGGVVAVTVRSYSHSTGPTGNHYSGGFYNAPAADADLTNASVTQVLGTGGIAYGAHALVVASGAGSTDGSDLVLTVSGTSITDGGVRTESDNEAVVADCTASSINDYYETTKKWIGQITYTLSSSGGSTFDYTFNYGFAKYDDFGDRDFTVTDFEITGMGGANDAGFNVVLCHHKPTGWTYHATAFDPISGTIVSLATDYDTETQLANGSPFAYKRTGLSTAVAGADSEGILVLIVTAQANALDTADIQVGVNLA